MNILENDQIYQLQTDYVNGTGEHGVVHKRYAAILDQYKKAYAECPVYEATGLMDLYMESESILKNAVTADIILIALSVFAFNGHIMWCVIAFIAAVVKWWQVEMEKPSDDSAYNNLGEYLENNAVTLSSFTEKSGRWFILPLVIVSFVMIISAMGVNINLTWVVYSTPLLINLYKNINAWKIAPKKAYAENKERVLKMQQAETELEEIRKQLRLLLPDLRAEYKQELKQAVNDMTGLEQKSVMRQYNVLPEYFWWEINPSQVLEKQMLQESNHESFMTSHEVAAIGRTFGNEFKNAGMNYAPMYAEKLTLKEINKIYQQNIQRILDQGGIVLDFVDCIKYGDVVEESELVKDYEFVENSFARDFQTGQWKELGEEIEKAHSHGALTNGEYGCLRNRYDELNPDVRGYINRKIEVGQHVETFHKFRIFARYEWTGQALLLPDTDNSGGFVLLDYRCRPEYEIENLEEIKDSLPITQIWADYVSGQQDFIANVQRMIIKRNEKSRESSARQKYDTGQVLSIVSIALICFFSIPMVSVVGIVLGIISRKKGGGKLAIVGIIVNVLGFIGQILLSLVIKSLLAFH